MTHNVSATGQSFVFSSNEPVKVTRVEDIVKRQAAPQQANDDVVDAEFTEVKDDQK